jgi:hypothetical protein
VLLSLGRLLLAINEFIKHLRFGCRPSDRGL